MPNLCCSNKINFYSIFRPKVITLQLALVISSLSGLVYADEVELSKTSLDDIVVIGTRTLGTIKNNPQSITVIKQKDIDKKISTGVADLLEDTPGVQATDANSAGTKRIRIRGESSRRVTILIDGQELTDHSTYGTPLLMDTSDIERIEVIRGPASVLYGAKAIGGVVNIITKNGGGNKPIGGEIGMGTFSDSHGWYYNTAVFGQIKNFDYRLSFYKDLFNDIKVPSSQYTSYESRLYNSGRNSEALNLNLGYSFGEALNHLVRLKVESSKLSAGNWREKAILDDAFIPLTSFDINLPKRDKTKIGLFYDGSDLNAVIKKVHFDTYYQKVKRSFQNSLTANIFQTDDYVMTSLRGNVPGFVERAIPGTLTALSPLLGQVEFGLNSLSNDDLINYGGTFQIDLQATKNHYVLLGVNFLSDRLESEKSNTTNFSNFPIPVALNNLGVPNGFSRVSPSYNKAHTDTFSVFIQDQWNIAEELKFTSGFRYYKIKNRLDENSKGEKSNSSDNKLLKSFSLVYTGIPNSALRIAYSEGYISPNLMQLYTVTSAGGIESIPNSKLKPETAKNIEIGGRFGNDNLTLDVAAFYTKAKNYISLHSCRDNPLCEGISKFRPASIVENSDHAKTYGLELNLDYAIPGTNFTPYLTATLMKRKESLEGRETYDTDTPKASGRIGLRYANDSTKNPYWIDAYVRGASRSTLAPELSLSNPGGKKPIEPIGSWATVNLSMGKTIKLKEDSQLQLTMAVNNITNTKYRSSFTSLPGSSRNVALSTKWTF